jgi:hypothetical protein
MVESSPAMVEVGREANTAVVGVNGAVFTYKCNLCYLLKLAASSIIIINMQRMF